MRVEDPRRDPVLGTKGGQVLAAKANEFKWKILSRAGEGAGGWWVVKDENLKVAGNAMGFKTGYHLTQAPQNFLTEEECEKLGLDVSARETESEAV